MRTLACVLLAGLAGSSCARLIPPFDDSRAGAHVEMLAGTIGRRPAGSHGDARARDYIVDQLRQGGFKVRLQSGDAIDSARGVTAPVSNIIALREGQNPDAVALVSHYDSVPDGPGAADDGLGVATCLEAARVLAGDRLQHSLMVLVTDGEELGLMGARLAVTDAEVARRLRGYLNFDGTSAAGPPFLYETGPGLSTALASWARGAAAPEGSSFSTEIYKRLPNDTDFTILKSLGAVGVNLSPMGDAYAYHTDRDIAARVHTDTLRLAIANAIAIVREMDRTDLSSRQDIPTYFDVFGRGAVVYGATATAAISWGGCALALATWILLTARVLRRRGVLGLFVVAIWSVLSLVATVAVMIAAVAFLRALRGELTPWYSAPWWLFASMAAAGAGTLSAVDRASECVPERFRPGHDPAATWWTTLPAWMGVTIFLQVAAPTASYLSGWPLLAAAILLTVSRAPGFVRLASLALLVVVVALWGSKVVTLLTFLVPLFGWLPIVTPVWLYPAVIALAGLMASPPILALVKGWRQTRRSATVDIALPLAWIVMFGVAYVSPAYTPDRPHRRSIRYVQDDIRHQAWWEAGGSERVLGFDAATPAGAHWQPTSAPLPVPVPMSVVSQPFRFLTSVSPAASAAPADVRMQIAQAAADHALVELTITPRDLVTMWIALPEGVVPLHSSLAGAVSQRRWTATYVGVPASGLTVRLTFAGHAASDLMANALVVLRVQGLPGGGGPSRLPAWLPVDRTAWEARSIYIEPIR